jgi:hypothetical protein
MLSGVGSAGVLDRLNDAFRNHLSSARSAGRPFHYITFEAGINDLLLQVSCVSCALVCQHMQLLA